MRYLEKTLAEFAAKKFVLLSGPRQVGKTTVARDWLTASTGEYFNWDIPDDRARILSPDFIRELASSKIVFDELHKYPRWKGMLKGLYDARHEDLKVVVTGSARLDVFRKGGDSLLGRYEKLRLHPFSVGELAGSSLEPPKKWELVGEKNAENSSGFEQLLQFGGFPEPFFQADSLQHRRWSTSRRDLLVREDLRELSQIKSVALVEQLALLLPSRIGAPLSINSLREDLQVAHDTAANWLDALEYLYFSFRISPYSKKIARALKKEQKLYLWDWSQIPDESKRFENLVASHLLKSVNAWTDIGYGEYSLSYFRLTDGTEIDFIIQKDGVPVCAIEAKLSDQPFPKAFETISSLFPELPTVQIVKQSGIYRRSRKMVSISADKFLRELV